MDYDILYHQLWEVFHPIMPLYLGRLPPVALPFPFTTLQELNIQQTHYYPQSYRITLDLIMYYDGYSLKEITALFMKMQQVAPGEMQICKIMHEEALYTKCYMQLVLQK